MNILFRDYKAMMKKFEWLVRKTEVRKEVRTQNHLFRVLQGDIQ